MKLSSLLNPKLIKCGLADILIDLMHRGWISGYVMNGAATIHDFEIAIEEGATIVRVGSALFAEEP